MDAMRPDHGRARHRRPRGGHRRRGPARHRPGTLGPLAGALLITACATGAPAASAVVGGTPSYQGQFPFMVSLRESGYPYCGGTLVAARWVLTAAHCVSGRSAGVLTAVVDQATRAGSAGQSFSVDRTVLDPDYNPNTESYDAALVHLSAPVSGIGPIGIDPSGTGDTAAAQPGMNAVVIGFGSVDPEDVDGNGPIAYPSTLQQASVTLDTDRTCTTVFNGSQEPAAHTDVMLCAGGDGRHDACVGDSGGPLLVAGGAFGWTQIGIVSWGAGCAVRGVPGVYTRLSDRQINEFILGTIGR
jgi:secreted trypsin-like serine protease